MTDEDRILPRGPVGQPLPHESAVGHVTGQALFTDDLAGRFPRLLHAWPVQSPHTHARVLTVHTERARTAAGVAAVLTAADVPGVNDTGVARQDEPLFPDEVMFHGQAVAWVLADCEAAARAAAGLVQVEYEPLPAILTLAAAAAAHSFHAGPLQIQQGEPESALTHAPHCLEGELYPGAQEHFYLETHAAIAFLDESGSVMVHSSTQHPTETQIIVARVLGVSASAVVVQSLRMGGAFGGKEVQANAWAAVAALGAWRTGRPVRVRLNRAQDMALTGKRHPFLGRFQAGFDARGRLLALDLDLLSDGGWSLDLSEPVLQRAMFHADNAYAIPHFRVTGRVARTHKASNTAFRGFGGPQGVVMVEEVLDRVARFLGLPPHQVRERNFYRPGDVTPYGQPVRDAERIHAIWSRLKGEADFDRRWAAVDQFNANGPHVKRGLAITPVKFGISFTAGHFNQAGALVLIYQDGTIQVTHGGTEMGQGLHTKMQQVAAAGLGVPLDQVRIMPTRTDKVPNTSATAASSGADLNGAAVLDACRRLRGRLAEVAGRMLGGDPAAVRFDQGRVCLAGGDAGDEAGEAGVPVVPFGRVVGQAYRERVPLFATGFYRTPGIHFDARVGRGEPFRYFAYGAAVSEVEVDGFTGAYRLLRVDICHDAGDSLNPLVDRGQIEGGFVQGLGWLTQEELVWDADGRLLTCGAGTYKLPGAAEVPEAFHVQLLPRATEPGVVFGSKAVGEPPLMLAISVREALRAAVAAFAPGGGRAAAASVAGGNASGAVTLPVPATPEAVYWAVARARTPAADS